jgi:hypothetical protein
MEQAARGGGTLSARALFQCTRDNVTCAAQGLLVGDRHGGTMLGHKGPRSFHSAPLCADPSFLIFNNPSR